VIQVDVPPLRERPEDIPLLTAEFLKESGGGGFELSADLLEQFLSYHWPGNVRELRNIVQRLQAGADTALTLPKGSPRRRVKEEPLDELSFKEAKEKLFDAFAREYLGALLTRCDGNVSEVARRSGLHRNHVQRLLEKHGLAPRHA
jgi:DNA-binding NtrC family response regulator